ncbi:hypothetical protein [Trichothermofontia sp.]
MAVSMLKDGTPVVLPLGELIQLLDAHPELVKGQAIKKQRKPSLLKAAASRKLRV